MSSGFGQRLKSALKNAQMTQTELAEALGIRQQSIGYACSEKATGSKYVLEMAKALKVHPDWLAHGINSSADYTLDAMVSEPPKNYVATAATPVTTLDNLNQGQLPTDTGEMIRCPVLHGPQVYAIRIENDHMTAQHGNGDSFKRGTIVFIDPEQAITSKDGDFVLAKFTETSGYSFNKLIITPAGRYLSALANGIPIVDKPFIIIGKHIGSWVPPSQ